MARALGHGAVEVIEGDALAVLPTFPEASFEAVIADPPYGIDYRSRFPKNRSQWVKGIANDARPFVWWLNEVPRVLVPGGCLLCFCRWDTAEAFRLAIQWAGLRIGAQLVWDRVVGGMGDTESRPAPQHDVIWFAVHGAFKYPGRRPGTVYRHQRLCGTTKSHPCEKPVALLSELITDYTAGGARVLDPFAGSGPTVLAALAEGRRCVAVEQDAHWCDLIEKRVAEATGVSAGRVKRRRA